MIEILVAVTMFTGIVLSLTLIVLLARAALMPSGEVRLVVNDTRVLQVTPGGKLLEILARAGLFLPSGCGGKGICGQCRVRVPAGAGAPLPTETSLLGMRELAAHVRLACQLVVRGDLEVRVPETVLGVRRWRCTVRSNRNVATFIKEIVLDLPGGEEFDFQAGGYIQIECEPFRAAFRDFDIEAQFRPEWDRYNFWRFEAATPVPVSRAYSLANHPGEKGIIMLNVRIATPPPGSDAGIPPGVVSSYIFSRRPGDMVAVIGPFGDFFVKDTDREMIFIGGGAGMAPLRSHLFNQLERLKTRRRISYWYGARSRRELFYVEQFDRLAAVHDNFEWHVALSEPRPEDRWEGHTGFIHQVVYEQHLMDHPAPEECEYYLCGPPLMIAAVLKMLEDLGVGRDNIVYDDFGEAPPGA